MGRGGMGLAGVCSSFGCIVQRFGEYIPYLLLALGAECKQCSTMAAGRGIKC